MSTWPDKRTRPPSGGKIESLERVLPGNGLLGYEPGNQILRSRVLLFEREIHELNLHQFLSNHIGIKLPLLGRTYARKPP